MKPTFSLILAVCVAGLAQAASPVVNGISAPSLLSGEVVTLSASVSDSDADLKEVKFLLAGPGISGWTTLGTVATTGASATRTQTWTATNSGLYTVRVEVTDLGNVTTAAQQTFDVFAERRTVGAFNLGSGQGLFLSARGELATTQDTAALSTTVANNANLVLWSTGRIVLRPGFKAAQGANFWAAIDHNENSYSDLEEATDTDGDGMFDAWEVDHGLNPFSAADRNSDLDGDGVSNFNEFAANRDPNNSVDGLGLPLGFDLVIVSGSARYGISTANWKIQSL